MNLLLPFEKLRIGSHPQKAFLYVMWNKACMRWSLLEIAYLAELNISVCSVCVFLWNLNKDGYFHSVNYSSGFKCSV